METENYGNRKHRTTSCTAKKNLNKANYNKTHLFKTHLFRKGFEGQVAGTLTIAMLDMTRCEKLF